MRVFIGHGREILCTCSREMLVRFEAVLGLRVNMRKLELILVVV